MRNCNVGSTECIEMVLESARGAQQMLSAAGAENLKRTCCGHR
jgi:hypothetical protein